MFGSGASLEGPRYQAKKIMEKDTVESVELLDDGDWKATSKSGLRAWGITKEQARERLEQLIDRETE